MPFWCFLYIYIYHSLPLHTHYTTRRKYKRSNVLYVVTQGHYVILCQLLVFLGSINRYFFPTKTTKVIPNELCDTTRNTIPWFSKPRSPAIADKLKCFLLYLLIRPLYPDVVILLYVQLFTMSKCYYISPMLKGLENLEDEIISVVCLIV